MRLFEPILCDEYISYNFKREFEFAVISQNLDEARFSYIYNLSVVLCVVCVWELV